MKVFYLWLFPLLALWLVVRFIGQWPDAFLHYVHCDVGQGDAILVSHRFTQVLIDSGATDAAIIDCLQAQLPFWDRHLEIVIATHADKDHIGALDGVLTDYTIGTFVWNGQDDSSSDWDPLRSWIQHHLPLAKSVSAGDILQLGPLEIEILWPILSLDQKKLMDKGKKDSDQGYQSLLLGDKDGSNSNEDSLVARLSFGAFSVLLTGDIAKEQEFSLMRHHANLQSVVLKVAHHGSQFSTHEVFLEAVQPQLVTIGVGAKNTYGHPSDALISLLNQKDINIYRTDKGGTVHIISNGAQWWVP